MLFREEGEENYNVESKNKTTSIKVKHQKAKDLFTTTSAATGPSGRPEEPLWQTRESKKGRTVDA